MIRAKEFLKDAKIYYSSNLINNPEVSVVLPTYCRGNNGLLERAIRSVLNQVYRNFELIIVDDGSVDRTREIVENFMRIDNRIVYIRNDINSGLPAIRTNQGIKESRGKYIAYQFDDDVWLPNFLTDLYGAILEKQQPCIVYGKAGLFNVLNKIEDVFRNEPNEELLKTRNLIANSSVLHSKEICYKYGVYDMHIFMRTACDWDLWQRWIKEVSFYFVDKLVCMVESFHEDSIGKTWSHKKALYNSISVQERNEKLSLDKFHEYELDDFEFIEDHDIKEIVYQHYILPFRLKHRMLIKENIAYSIDSLYVIKDMNYNELLKKNVNELRGKIGTGYICYVVHSGYIGGGENHLLRHAILSKKYGLNVLVCLNTKYTNSNCDVYKVCSRNHIKVRYLDYDIYTSPNNILEGVADIKGNNIVGFFKKTNAKLIHSCTLIPAVKVAANELNIPYIASLYAILEDTKPILGLKRLKYLPDMVHSDALIYANRWSKDMRVYSKCIRSYTPNSFFSSYKRLGFSKKTLNVIISGTLQVRKGQAEAIEAIGLLKNEGIDMSLKILGYDIFDDEYKDKCNELIKQFNVEDRVEIKGFCMDIEKEMDNADILLCASTVESLPQVILEGMAKRLLIISTPVGGVPEVIIDGYSGYLCKGYDINHIVEALKRAYYDFIHNKSKLQNIIDNAYNLVVEECKENRVAYELFLFYKTALNGNFQSHYEDILHCIDEENTFDNYVQGSKECIDTNPIGKGHNNLGNLQKRYVPQDIGLKASNKIRFSKSYIISIREESISKLSVYFGTYGDTLGGTMIVKIKGVANNVLREYKYDMSVIEDNIEFVIDINPPLENISRFIIEFFIYSNKVNQLSLYENGKNSLYFEVN